MKRIKPAWVLLSAATKAIEWSPSRIILNSNPVSNLPASNHPPLKSKDSHSGSRILLSFLSLFFFSLIVSSNPSQFRHGTKIAIIAKSSRVTLHIARYLAKSIGETTISSIKMNAIESIDSAMMTVNHHVQITRWRLNSDCFC